MSSDALIPTDIMKDWPRNPATVFKDFMLMNMHHTPGALDMEAITLWEKFCDDNGLILDGLVLDQPLFELFSFIAKAGHAMPVFTPMGVQVYVDIKDTQEKVKQ